MIVPVSSLKIQPAVASFFVLKETSSYQTEHHTQTLPKSSSEDQKNGIRTSDHIQCGENNFSVILEISCTNGTMKTPGSLPHLQKPTAWPFEILLRTWKSVAALYMLCIFLALHKMMKLIYVNGNPKRTEGNMYNPKEASWPKMTWESI